MNHGHTPKRVLIFSLTYYPHFLGGAEVAIKEITERIAPEAVEFDMITLRFDKKLPKFERIGNVNVYRIGFAGKCETIEASYKFPLSLNKYLMPFIGFFKAVSLHEKRRYDSAWAVMATYSAFAALFFKLVSPRVRLLLTLQEGDSFEHIKRRLGVMYPLYRRIFKKADHMQTISHYLADYARSMGYRGNVSIVPNGVDVARFSHPYHDSDIFPVRDKLGKKYTDTYLVTTSRLVPKNAVDIIIKALPHLPETVTLLVIGEGPEAWHLHELVTSLDLTKRVKFLGFIQHADLPRYLKVADIFVRPSRSEGFGVSFVEAMAARVPVVATPVGGIIDFLIDKETGLVATVDDPKSVAKAVMTLMLDTRIRNHVTATAYKMVSERYEWNDIARRMQEIFETL